MSDDQPDGFSNEEEQWGKLGEEEGLAALFAEQEDATDDSEESCPSGTPKLDPDYAGYMELSGATKDGDCQIVSGGISKDLGCCNLFHPDGDPDKFSCGTCKYLG